jgi:hypothetical protein
MQRVQGKSANNDVRVLSLAPLAVLTRKRKRKAKGVIAEMMKDQTHSVLMLAKGELR